MAYKQKHPYIMQILLILRRANIRGRLKWWLLERDKHCHGCCIFCKYFEGCIIEKSNEDAEQEIEAFIQGVENALDNGLDISEQDVKIYYELIQERSEREKAAALRNKNK